MVPYEGSLQIRTNQFIQFSNKPYFESLRYVSNCSLYFFTNQAGHTNRFVLLSKRSCVLPGLIHNVLLHITGNPRGHSLVWHGLNNL